MRGGSVFFGGIDLAAYGEVRLTMQRTPDPAPPARATRYQVTYGVSVRLSAEAASTLWARSEALREVLDTAEATLEVRNENGTGYQWRVRPTGDNLREASTHGLAEFTLGFTGWQALHSPDGITSSLTVAGEPTLPLDHITDWTEAIRTERPDPRLANRALTTTTISFAAVLAHADPSLAPNDRLAALHTARETYDAWSGAEATLVHGSLSRPVQIENIRCRIDADQQRLLADIQCRHTALPGDTTAEVDYTVSTSEDRSSGEIVTSISGKITAPDQATAEAKLAAIRASYETAERRLMRSTPVHRYLDGEDADDPGGTWSHLQFSLELRETAAATTSFTLDISDQQDGNGKKTVYSGTVRGDTLANALAKAATLGDGMAGTQIGSRITTHYVGNPGTGDSNYVSLDYSYEYIALATAMRGTVTSSATESPGTGRRLVVSGQLSGPGTTLDLFNHVKNAFISITDVVEEVREDTIQHGNAFGDASHVSFSYTVRNIGARTTTATFSNALRADYRAMQGTRTIAGSICAGNEGEARAHYSTLIAGYGDPSEETLTPHYLNNDSGTPAKFLHLSFSATFQEALSGTIAHDIIHATVALERIGQVNHEPITVAPGTEPIRQSAAGWSKGRLTVSGSVRARVQATARSWGQAKRALATTAGTGPAEETGAPLPPREGMKQVFLPFSGSNALFYEFSFSYGFEYATALKNLWSADTDISYPPA